MSSTPGLPRDWIPTLMRLLERQPTVARVVVTEARGSTPREPGAFMLVGHNCVEGSIGGGRLEWEAIAAARSLLADPAVPARTNKVVLAADVGQCCGGVVSFWLEKFTRDDLALLRTAADAGARSPAVLVGEVNAGVLRRRIVRREVHPRTRLTAPPAVGAPTDTASAETAAHAITQLLNHPRRYASPIVLDGAPNTLTFLERLDDNLPAVWLYGAGHVGQALARILTELPLRLTWIDSRAELFPQTLPDAVRVLQDPDPVATVHEAPVGAYFIVMSHSHPLDFDLCHALLERNDFAWLGLIGSDSKAARFRSRLARTGLGPEVIGKLVCPIGVEGITSKWPAAIAVAVAAQLMQRISVVAECPEGLPMAATPGNPTSRRRADEPAQPQPSRNRGMPPEVGSADEAGAYHVPQLASVASALRATPCAPELCATCGTPVTSGHAAGLDPLSHNADGSSTATPAPRDHTVPS
jgi:xanthine dehydrogenase accessory factor